MNAPAFSPDPPADLELRLVDPPTNRARLYAVTEARTLLPAEPWALEIVWGRIGRPPRRRMETFATREDLERRRRSLLATRRRHGYVAVTSDVDEVKVREPAVRPELRLLNKPGGHGAGEIGARELEQPLPMRAPQLALEGVEREPLPDPA